MKTEINCPVLSSEKFSKEVLKDIITSLEQLENTKNNIFNRLNNAFNERYNKLCNIKARIIRANKIIESYSSINEAITLKSKYHYPSKKHNYYTPTIIDQNSTRVKPEPMVKLNRIALNDKEKLGAKSLAAKDKIVTYDKYLSYATQFNDIVNELNKVTSQEISIRQDLDDFEPILNHVTSDFTFGTNMKIEYAKKQQYNPQQEINRGGSILLQDYLNEKKEEERKKKKNIQQAPKSIIEKQKIRRTVPKKKKIKNTPKVNFVLPTNIALGGVANLEGSEDDDEKKEENKIEEEEDDDDDFKDDNQNEGQFINEEDEEDTDLPIDYIRYNNQIKIDTNRINQNANYNNNQTSTTTNNNSANQSQSQPTPPPPPPPSAPQTQINTAQVNTATVPQPPPQKQVVPPPQQRPPNPPPAVPTASKIQVVVGNSSSIPPPPPPPPPPPVVPTIPTKPSSAKVETKSSGGEVSLEDELAKAMSGLKKTGKVELDEKPKPKELSFAEQLAMSRNKLKKPVIVEKPPPKKQNCMDLLSQQIRLRFQQLRMHEDDNEDSDSEDDK
jgi:hypothetical protein